MTTFAQPASTLISRTRLQLAAALVAGIAIGSSAAAGLIDGPRAAADPVVEAAPAAQAPVVPRTRESTSASEQYRAWYTRRQEHRPSTTAGEQYRAWYTSEE
jgi:hypothetical protein